MTPDRDAEDINTRVVKEWVADTTPEERVRSIMKRTYHPQSTEQIADRARVTPVRAEHILGELHEAGFVSRVTDVEGTWWIRSARSIARERADRLDTPD